MTDLRFRFLLPEYDVFIAFSKGDGHYARQLTAALSELGISSYCEHDMAPGDDWTLILPEAAKRSKRIVAIVSPNIQADPYFVHHVDFAKRHDKLIILTQEMFMNQGPRKLAEQLKATFWRA